MERFQPLVPQEVKRHRYPELDALRGLAALTVVFHHLLMVWGGAHWYRVLLATPLRLFSSGPQAVTLFFVLSGFVLSGPQSSTRTSSYARYLCKRLCRLYLPFLAALLLAFLFDQRFYLRTLTLNQWFNGTWSYRAPIWQLAEAALTNLTYAQLFNTAFWSVFLEVQISVVFPLLFLFVRRVSWRHSLFTIAGLLFGAVFVRSGTWFLVLQALCCFLLGILAYLHLPALTRWITTRSTRSRFLLLFVALLAYTYAHETVFLPAVAPDAAAAYAASTLPAVQLPAASLHYFFLIGVSQLRFAGGMLASLLLMLCAITFPGLIQFLTRPVLLRMGALSYSTYLIHGTVLFAMLRTVQGVSAAAFVVSFLALVYVGSEVFHAAIDAPAVRLGRWVGTISLWHVLGGTKSKEGTAALPL